MSAQTWATVRRRSEGDHDQHHLGLAGGSGLHDDHPDHVVDDPAMPLDHPYLLQCLYRNDLGGG